MRDEIRWQVGDRAGHRLAPGAVLEITAVVDEERVRAKLVQRGKLKLPKGREYPFLKEYLEPVV